MTAMSQPPPRLLAVRDARKTSCGPERHGPSLAVIRLAAVLAGLSVLLAVRPVPACPMCEPVRDTLSDRIRQAAVAIVAEVAEPAADGLASPAAGSAASRTRCTPPSPAI